MNIFASDPCPVLSAKYLDNKRRNKMLIESCQILSTALHIHGISAPYKPTHKNHPCVVWAALNKSNFKWVLDHAKELNRLYTEKTDKVHGCDKVLAVLASLVNNMPDGSLTPFANCCANKSLGIDYRNIYNVHIAYQLYLNDRWKK